MTVRDSGFAIVIDEAKLLGVALPESIQVVIWPFVAVGSVARQKVTLETFEPLALTVPFKTALVPVTEVAAVVCTLGAPAMKDKINPWVVPCEFVPSTR